MTEQPAMLLYITWISSYASINWWA